MNQALALEIMLAGHSVLLTGPAGSGKTYVLAEFIRQSKRSGRSVAVTATTGLAASHLGGTTIHAWSGLGVAAAVPDTFVANLSKARHEAITKADVLVIDEISMLHDYWLDMVDKAMRLVRENDRPFGGLQVVLCGDFFQLPPVVRGSQAEANFVVSSQAWQALDPVICLLSEQHRQDDADFLTILNALRAGDIRRAHAEALLGRVDVNLDGAATELHTTNVDVDRINATQLAAMPGQEHEFAMTTTGKDTYVESLKRSCLAMEQLVLKPGAMVMCIKNSPDRKYVNGSLGVVSGFEELTGYPEVTLRSGRTVVITPESWELRDGDKKRASLTQLPLRLAWAITIHKSQGMTLDAARIDLRRAFVPGMGYVALSRVRRLASLSLAGINKMALAVSPQALAIDAQLREQAARDALRFADLAAAATARQDSPLAVAPTEGWAAKLAAMRVEYPNAFRPWTAADDARLQQLFHDGAAMRAISAALGRQPGGIAARIKKHFGEEAVISD